MSLYPRVKKYRTDYQCEFCSDYDGSMTLLDCEEIQDSEYRIAKTYELICPCCHHSAAGNTIEEAYINFVNMLHVANLTRAIRNLSRLLSLSARNNRSEDHGV